MDPSSADNYRCQKLRKHWSLRPACHFRDRALASCFFCRRVSSMLIQPGGKQQRRFEDQPGASGLPPVRILKPESLVKNEIDMRHQSNNQSQQISLISQISTTERPSCAYCQFSEHSPVGHASHQKSWRETKPLDRALVGWKGGSGVKLQESLMLQSP